VASTGDLLDVSLRAFLDELAGELPAPAGGSIAALVVAMAAGLTAKVARASDDWREQMAAVAQAEKLRRRIAPLAQSGAEAYEEALAALRLPDRLEPQVRDMAIGNVLVRSAEVPLQIAETGADVASLAALVADRGAPDRRGDAASAAILAEAGTRVAATLVAVNLTVTPEDERIGRARLQVELAAEAARNALAAAES
jgi:glutamate formiminotransferase/formiminotetrahydrofolate cyclodeaminase